ncbi:MAG: T9SS type A sorting domain-containing protein [Bacteroidia bacterium]|nr:T9SS type A sorting domain-containing protein [Bacteroidia bacterium]
MSRISAISLLLLLYTHSQGQTPVGSWSDHLTYNTAKSVAAGSSEIYASTGSSIIVYNKEFASLKRMSRINGLTETGISTIAWSEENKTLIIAYTSSNVDLVKNNIIYNIPDINRKYIPGKKEINRIRTNGKFAYLACSFGIVVVDIIKKEIYDTWKPGTSSENTEVWDIAFGNSKIYAATGNGVFSAEISNPGLAYFENWSRISNLPNPTGKYTSLVYSGNKLYANLSYPISGGDKVYVIDGTSSLFPDLPGVYNTSFDPATSGFTISSPSSVRYYNNDGALIRTISSYGYGWRTPNISQAIADNGDIWIADINSGLVRGNNMPPFDSLTLPGPVSNNAYNITSYNGKTIICGGAATASWNNVGNPLQISIHENNKWTSISSGTIKDAMRALIDPDNSNHFFVSTWGGGLLEYKDDNPAIQYTESNSPLQTIIPGQPYVRICGLAMDKDKNLWITQTADPVRIYVLKPDGHWIENPALIVAPTIGDIIITRTGHKWIVLPRGYGLFILDDNNTPEIFNDDKIHKMLVTDTENNVISNVYSIAEDLDGNIWVGTDQGPFVYYNPEKVFDNNLKANRIKIPRNDGSGLSDYLLKNETITSIAIDGANRKWMGTLSSGAYHLSPDGTILLKNYNEQNSPILSNSIVSLTLDNKTGDVWFGTSKGIQSFRSDATTGEEKFTNVYTFPNPVREDFTGNVTITGLMRDSQIRITDISGNLVYKTVSNGGQATWDLKTYNGLHVATGVYLVFCASNDGSQSFVTKMLVIR